MEENGLVPLGEPSDCTGFCLLAPASGEHDPAEEDAGAVMGEVACDDGFIMKLLIRSE
jgi:hypothetical protein